MIKTYFKLTKPGIIMGNAITAAGGFALASKGHLDFFSLFTMLLGLSFIVASGCVFNNYLDRDIDEKMARTRNRALVKREVSIRNAVIFAGVLVVCGVATLMAFNNLLTLIIALAGLFVYVLLYSLLKTRTSYATLIGSIAGAVPPLVGYLAASDRVDLGGVLLFAIVALWQMPHFFAIAMYRYDDYAAADIPVHPVVKGMHSTKIHMLVYTIAFITVSLLLTYFGYTGYAYLAVASSAGLAWLILCIKGFKAKNDKVWAYKMFRLSLVVITAFSIMISVDTM